MFPSNGERLARSQWLRDAVDAFERDAAPEEAPQNGSAVLNNEHATAAEMLALEASCERLSLSPVDAAGAPREGVILVNGAQYSVARARRLCDLVAEILELDALNEQLSLPLRAGADNEHMRAAVLCWLAADWATTAGSPGRADALRTRAASFRAHAGEYAKGREVGRGANEALSALRSEMEQD